jgi:hypothetical protein
MSSSVVHNHHFQLATILSAPTRSPALQAETERACHKHQDMREKTNEHALFRLKSVPLAACYLGWLALLPSPTLYHIVQDQMCSWAVSYEVPHKGLTSTRRAVLSLSLSLSLRKWQVASCFLVSPRFHPTSERFVNVLVCLLLGTPSLFQILIISKSFASHKCHSAPTP